MHALTNQVDVVIIISLEYIVINCSNNSAYSHEQALIKIKNKTLTHAPFRHIARQEGFEPTRVLRQMVLETITFDHSVTAAYCGASGTQTHDLLSANQVL